MQDTAFRLIVGARGWTHAGWAGRYYPDNLPPEWRLAYYANDFTGVLIPAAEWQGAPRAAWQAWHDDTPPGFRFLLEAEPGQSLDRAPPTELLGEKFAGWVPRGDDPVEACLTAAQLADPAADRADVVLCHGADLADRRALGRRLSALAKRARPLVALVALDDVPPSDLRELRLLAELTGLA